MRHGLTCLTLLAALGSHISSQPALCGYRTTAEAGVANVLLFYCDPGRQNLSACHSLSDAFVPYIGYLDKSGKVVDRFFDGIVFIDIRPFLSDPSAATKEEWENYLETTFKARCIDRRPTFSSPGYMSNQCVQIPCRNGCVHQDLICPQDRLLTLRFYVRVDTVSDEPYDGYIGVMAFDRDGRDLRDGLGGLTYSNYLGLWYRYVQADTSWEEAGFQFQLPPHVRHLSIFLGSWQTPGIRYDNVRLDGGTIADGDFERQTSAWKSRDFPYLPPFPHDRSAMLAALDKAVRMVAEQLRDPSMRESVILMIPWDHCSHLQTNFGWIDGKERDLSMRSDATIVVKWFIKRCIDEWRRLGPKWLKLTGFYWLNEAGNDLDKVNLPEISAYLRRLGYRLYGSPYHDFWREPSKGGEYVPYFDCLWLQPNAWPPNYKESKHYYSAVKTAHSEGWLSADSALVRKNGIPLDELKEAETMAESLNMGINMEWVRGQESVKGYGRILDYVNKDGSLPHDFGKASHLFYDDGGFGWYCCYSDDQVFRHQYDVVYQFVRRTGRP